MTRIKRFVGLIGLTALGVIFFTGDAQAYIDTSTGSYIIQILLAGLMGILLTLKVFWRQVKAYFSKDKTGNDKSSDISEDKTD